MAKLILIFKTAFQDSEVEISIEQLLPSKNPDTVMLKYKSPANFDKFIFISLLEIPAKNRTNFHLLRGGTVAATIGIRHFETTQLYLNFININILVPQNVERYLFFYENGEFLECDQTLALR